MTPSSRMDSGPVALRSTAPSGGHHLLLDGIYRRVEERRPSDLRVDARSFCGDAPYPESAPRNVLGARGVRGVLEQYLEAGEFPGNEHGAPIGSVIEPDVHPANAIVEEILAAEPMPPLPDEPDHEEGRTAALLDHLMSDVTDEGRIALVADDFSFKTGAPIPIQTALPHGPAELLSRIVIVDVRAFNSARDLARELSRYRIVLGQQPRLFLAKQNRRELLLPVPVGVRERLCLRTRDRVGIRS